MVLHCLRVSQVCTIDIITFVYIVDSGNRSPVLIRLDYLLGFYYF